MRESAVLRRAVPSLVTLLTGVFVAAWTLALPTIIDVWWPWPAPVAGARAGTVALVWGMVLQPVVAYLAMLVLVVVLVRRRWRDLAASLVLAGVLTVTLTTVVKHVVARQRPVTDWLGGLHADASFPSGHASAAVALAIAATQFTWAVTRRRRPTVVAGVVGGLIAAAVMAGRLVLGVHHVSDVLGGGLVAAFCAALAGVLTGAWRTGAPPAGPPRRLVVVWHPDRVRGRVGLERFLASEAARRGFPAPRWVATSPDDPGAGPAAAALADGADVVVALGGDGTVREVLTALAGSPAASAVLPAGTGNLLAKNLGIPLDAPRACRLALDAAARPLDLLRVEVPGHTARLAAVLAGAGSDAAVLEDTSERAKTAGGPLGYVLAGFRHLRAAPFTATVTVDGDAGVVEASLVAVGNVGLLHPGVALLPAADPADGRLDVLIASPRGRGDVLAMIGGVLAGRRTQQRVTRLSGTRLRFELSAPTPFQVDGDVVGHVTAAEIAVVPGAVSVIRPA